MNISEVKDKSTIGIKKEFRVREAGSWIFGGKKKNKVSVDKVPVIIK